MSGSHRSKKRLPLIVAAVVLVTMAAIAAGLAVLRSTKPRTLFMATATSGSAYHQFGERYRELLARDGIDLQVVTTEGDLDNLERLRDPASGVSVAFLQGGVTDERESPGLVSLGTVFNTPFWFFYRGKPPATPADMFSRKRVSIGPEGSGTRKLAADLIADLGVDVTDTQWFGLAPEEASAALLRGELDAVALDAPWESAPMRRMLGSAEIGVMPPPHADALIAINPHLIKLVVPEGVDDLSHDRPSRDLEMVALRTSLVVRDDLNPAPQYALLEVATQVHSGSGVFQRAGQFPAAEPVDLPLSRDARQYYRTGTPFLQRYLPIWLAILLSQWFVPLLPVLGVAYPLLRTAPQIFDWSMRRRIFIIYGELRFLEEDLASREPGQSVDDLREELERLAERANRIRVPRALTSMLYTLHNHIAMVRQRIEGRPVIAAPE
jgi:TRAP-type uncharacterized transport system substrate-binding protein